MTGRALDLDINVYGAPNFRQNKSAMNVFGVAQPRITGMKALLSLLQCNPGSSIQSRCHWFSTREEPIGELFSQQAPTVGADTVKTQCILVAVHSSCATPRLPEKESL